MTSKAYNLLWISPQFAPTEGAGAFREPIPSKTVENILDIAARNPDVDVRLWIDSKRLTSAQMTWLEDIAAHLPIRQYILQDLRTIPAYNQQSLFNQADNSPDWRFNKHSLVWRQVDAARILACLQGNYDQSFYSDADVTNLNVTSDEIQGRITKHGVVLSGGVSNGYAWY